MGFLSRDRPRRSHQALALVGFVGLCLLVGAADGSIVAGPSRGWYLSLNRPPGTPPNWLFAPVWTGLYAMIGVAGWLVWRRAIGDAAAAPLGLAARRQRVLDPGLLRAAQPAAGARRVPACCWC